MCSMVNGYFWDAWMSPSQEHQEEMLASQVHVDEFDAACVCGLYTEYII